MEHQQPPEANAEKPASPRPDTPRVQEPATGAENNRAPRLLIPALLVALALLLLVLPRCTTPGPARSIERVPALAESSGELAVWMRPGIDIELVLAECGIPTLDVTHLERGRCIVRVPAGTESAAIERLCRHAGVYDAGPVYLGATLEPGEVTGPLRPSRSSRAP